MEAKRISFRRLFATALVALATLTVPATAAHARATSTTASGSCWATPNPVAVGQDYAVSGNRLGANRMVNVWVADAAGTQWGSKITNADGTVSVQFHASVLGTYSVKITDSGRKPATLATCSFSAS
jgi:hypothetical protein